MKQDIKKELLKYKMIEPISHLILTYADIKHPHSILFNQSKFKKVFSDFELTPVHVLKPIKKKTVTFELILFNQNHKQTRLYI